MGVYKKGAEALGKSVDKQLNNKRERAPDKQADNRGINKSREPLTNNGITTARSKRVFPENRTITGNLIYKRKTNYLINSRKTGGKQKVAWLAGEKRF